METVKHDLGCAVGAPFPKSQSMIMIKSLLEIIRKQYPWVQEIEYSDKSMTDCGDQMIMLPYLMIAERGQTWYESHLDSAIKNEVERGLYKESLHRLTLPESKAMSYDDFCDMYKAEHNDAEVRELYNKADSMRGFLDRIRGAFLVDRSNVSKIAYCSRLIPWLQFFMERNVRFATLWTISMSERKPFISAANVVEDNGSAKIRVPDLGAAEATSTAAQMGAGSKKMMSNRPQHTNAAMKRKLIRQGKFTHIDEAL